ncbi:hypothetical protein FRC19_004417 [Serendipita sp. 401]|nr:hypothetical protein FRC19_004417 [Serendipita sp. 401]
MASPLTPQGTSGRANSIHTSVDPLTAAWLAWLLDETLDPEETPLGSHDDTQAQGDQGSGVVEIAESAQIHANTEDHQRYVTGPTAALLWNIYVPDNSPVPLMESGEPTDPSKLVACSTTATTDTAAQVWQGTAAVADFEAAREGMAEEPTGVTVASALYAEPNHSDSRPLSSPRQGRGSEEKENADPNSPPNPQYSFIDTTKSTGAPQPSTKQRFHCGEPGCEKDFPNRYNLERHTKLHNNPEGERCPFPKCKKRVISRLDGVFRHLQLCHGISGRTCPYCKRTTFISTIEFSLHLMDKDSLCHPSKHQEDGPGKGQEEKEGEGEEEGRI